MGQYCTPIHSWLVGTIILLNKRDSEDLFIKKIKIEGVPTVELDFFETISMWTITALCHDLGYPLEKSQQIFNKTSCMLEYFISNPKMSIDLNFSGVQDYINNHIVKFLSSRMEDNTHARPAGDKKVYTGRVQPKYYIKLSKSLESYNHGIIGSIILFKTLIYFLETDFNVNEDYYYKLEETKQFYLRREILRAIASHTCYDVYHLKTTTLSFLLIICDDLQEWGRKKWIDFYKGTGDDNMIKTQLVRFDHEEVEIHETIKTIDEDNVLKSISIIYDQFERYKKLFREGQETDQRNFNFSKSFELKNDGERVYKLKVVNFSIPSNGNANIDVEFTSLTSLTSNPLIIELEKHYETATTGKKLKLIKRKSR